MFKKREARQRDIINYILSLNGIPSGYTTMMTDNALLRINGIGKRRLCKIRQLWGINTANPMLTGEITPSMGRCINT